MKNGSERITLCCGPSFIWRSSSPREDPMTKLPDGTFTIANPIFSLRDSTNCWAVRGVCRIHNSACSRLTVAVSNSNHSRLGSRFLGECFILGKLFHLLSDDNQFVKSLHLHKPHRLKHPPLASSRKLRQARSWPGVHFLQRKAFCKSPLGLHNIENLFLPLTQDLNFLPYRAF